MKYLVYAVFIIPMIYIGYWAWRQLDAALDDVFKTPIHNPYQEEDENLYGDIPNPHDDR